MSRAPRRPSAGTSFSVARRITNGAASGIDQTYLMGMLPKARPPRSGKDTATVIVCAAIVGLAVHVAMSAQRLLTLSPLDSTGRVTYFIGEGVPGSQFRPGDRELAGWALKAWERTTGGALRFEPSREQD